MTDKAERNIRNVHGLYEMAFNDGQPRRATELFVGDHYIQHNPLVGDGIEPFVDYFERMAREHPTKRLEIKRTFTDGDFVILHCYQHWPDDQDYAGMDIFRCDENGKVVEHWDVLQVIPPGSANSNGMF